MLQSLTIRNFVIVDSLTLEFNQGFTVLTGETGAGKSIIIDALSLLLGSRGDGSLVREGALRAELGASFNVIPNSALAVWLNEHALSDDDGSVLLRRTVDSNGRSKAFINGQPVTLTQLKYAGEHLVDIHGQHAHQSLVKAETQRALLDAYAGASTQAQEVAHIYMAWQAAKTTRLNAQQHEQHDEIERERLSWQLNELSELQLQADEWHILTQQHTRLAHAQELSASAQGALDTLSENDGSLLTGLRQVHSRLNKRADLDAHLGDALGLIASAEAELQEAVSALRHYLADIEHDPHTLTQLEARMEKLHTLARKYRVEPDALLNKLTDTQAQLDALAQRADSQVLAAHEAELEAQYLDSAQQLSTIRHSASTRLGDSISQEMHTLAMDGSRFAIALNPLTSPSAHGLESIDYLVAANAGTSLRPLAKVASGGELSRISLALQVVISQIAAVPTLIFDEVDVGIGGRVAEVVGRLLARLGAHYQVLCITHLPQVAAYGSNHWRVEKSTQGSRTVSHIEELDAAQRIQEIARMLGGESITDTTRQHAAELLGHGTTLTAQTRPTLEEEKRYAKT